MKTNTMVGFVAGSVIGAGVALCALPFLEPHFGKKMKKGKRMLRRKIHKMI